MTLTVILTRPIAASKDFDAMLRAASQVPFSTIVSPLIRIDYRAIADVTADAAIFTSVHGVNAASGLGWKQGTLAWCVGPQTAARAADAGFEVHQGPGDAEGLVRSLIAADIHGHLIHIRGRHTRGDICNRLRAAGLMCSEIIGYDQVTQDLSDAAVRALSGTSKLIFPLFSPRTANILSAQMPKDRPMHIVAISDAVADELAQRSNWPVVVAPEPNATGMVHATADLLSTLA